MNIKLQFGELTVTPSVEKRLAELGYTVDELQEAIADHKSECDGEPSVYCGSYGKYASSSLQGLWIDLSSFNDYEDFCNFCQAIHADEPYGCEPMFQDYEGFPRCYYSESGFSEEDFEAILEYSDMCQKHGADAIDDYLEHHENLDHFEEAYCGEWSSEEDFARHIVDECYDLERTMGNLSQYFDYEQFARDLFMYDYTFGSNGNVFRVI